MNSSAPAALHAVQAPTVQSGSLRRILPCQSRPGVLPTRSHCFDSAAAARAGE